MRLLFTFFLTFITFSLFSMENEIMDLQYENEDILPEEYQLPSFTFQAGVWSLSQLSEGFKLAPFFGMYGSIYKKNSSAVDLGALFAFPVKPDYFDFYPYGDEPEASFYEVKPTFLFNMNLRYRYEKLMDNGFYLGQYIGLGWNYLVTDLEDGSSSNYITYDYDDDYYDDGISYHSMSTFDLFVGISCRRGPIGLFMEFHIIPYSITDKVRKSTSNCTWNMGILYAF